MKKYRAAVIGLGFIGPLHLDALMRVPQAEIAAVCDANPAALRLQAERLGIPAVSDWHAVIADPSIEVIHNCLPPALHDEVNRAALTAGKHLYCEKPLSLTAASARKIAVLAEKQGVRAALNHQYRMNAAVREMRAQVQKGTTGRVLAGTGCGLFSSVEEGCRRLSVKERVVLPDPERVRMYADCRREYERIAGGLGTVYQL